LAYTVALENFYPYSNVCGWLTAQLFYFRKSFSYVELVPCADITVPLKRYIRSFNIPNNVNNGLMEGRAVAGFCITYSLLFSTSRLVSLSLTSFNPETPLRFKFLSQSFLALIDRSTAYDGDDRLFCTYHRHIKRALDAVAAAVTEPSNQQKAAAPFLFRAYGMYSERL
jgi:hypothetical protein